MRVLAVLASHGLVPELTPVHLLVLRGLQELLRRAGVDDAVRDAAVAAFIVRRSDELEPIAGSAGLSLEALHDFVREDADQTRLSWSRRSRDARWPGVVSALRQAEEIRCATIAVAPDDPASFAALMQCVAALGDADLSACFERLFAVKPKRRAASKAISVQIDVAGSTQAKARARETAQGDEARRREAYESVYSALVDAEIAFYAQLQSCVAGVRGIDLAQCFGIKGIGDEQWLLVETDGDNPFGFRNAIAQVLNAALAVVRAPSGWLDLRPPSERDDESLPDPRLVALPLKVFVDLIGDDAIDIAAMRMEAYGRAVATRNLFVPDLRSLPDIATRLTNQTALAGIGSLRVATRSDYIGWEIDRLFRAAKFALPGVVTVGDALMQALGATPTDGLGPIGRFELCFQPSCGRPIENSVRKFSRCIAKEDLHGIGEDYAVHHVFRAAELRKLHDVIVNATGSGAVLAKTSRILGVALDRLADD